MSSNGTESHRGPPGLVPGLAHFFMPPAVALVLTVPLDALRTWSQ